jgi:hypothetical protein
MQLALRPLLVGVLLAVLLGGCAQRTLTITSDPPGALVWLNDAEIGRTPITTEVADYGDYELILRHEGHETLKTSRGFWPAIYMIPPLDFLSELVGARHHKTWNFVLEPATTQPAAGIITRAEEARQQLRSSRHTTTQRATRATTGPSAR